MQDIYAFDVGDFGKLGLLRHLSAATHLSLGVLWWKTHLGSAGADGKHTNYLKDAAYSKCDPWLWNEMRERYGSGPRAVAALHPLLPAGTFFHDTPVPSSRMGRESWFSEVSAAVRCEASGADLLFCDPDNGVVFDGAQPSARHVGFSEIRSLHDAGHSIVVYHHLNRSASHHQQIRDALLKFRRSLPGLESAWGARFRRGSSRVFFVLPQPQHTEPIQAAIGGFSRSEWVRAGHFEVLAELGSGQQVRSS